MKYVTFFVFLVGNVATDSSYSAENFTSGLLNDDIIRSIAGQTTTSQSSAVEALAYQRQQALNSVLQQAAAAAGMFPVLFLIFVH